MPHAKRDGRLHVAVVSLVTGAGIRSRMETERPAREGGEFGVDVEPSPHGPIVSVAGDVDLHSAPELRDRLAAIIDEDAAHVTLDLSEATFLDSMALGVLLGAKKRLATTGGELALVVSNPDIRRVFEITMLDRVFAIHHSRAAAVASGDREPS